jgi:ketosteroid isomerase-like protein
MKAPLVACLLIALSSPGTLASPQGAAPAAEPASTQQERDIAALRKAILRSGEAFNAADPEAILSQYARDVILSYPGVPDMDYDTLAKGYAELRTRKPGFTEKTSPTIEEILVSGDLGVIRVMWTTVTTETDPPRESTRQMKDLQVWRRESDGTWMFIRGMHYRMKPPAAAAAGGQ